MKKLLFLMIFSTFFMSSQAQNVKVGADNSFKESLDNYSTFGWSAEINNIPSDAIFVAPGGVYVFNNESTKAKIKEAIQFELNAKGYTESATDPQILVLFEITENPGKLVTFNGYDVVDGEKMRMDKDRERIDIAAGTLLINLVDTKTGLVAWQGYASGILNPDMINDNVKVRQAVASIFNNFKFKAKK